MQNFITYKQNGSKNNMENPEKTTYPEKPKFLYHGSPNGDIEEFTPRVSLGSGEKHGAQVYASDSLAVACMFTCKPGRSWSAGTHNGETFAVLPMTREEFLEKDKGGYIYKFDSDTFSTEEGRGMGNKEWASSVAVKPVEIIRIESSLEAMIKSGVQVYFVNPQVYDAALLARKNSWEIVKDMKPENKDGEIGGTE
jgi:hypothetical protein